MFGSVGLARFLRVVLYVNAALAVILASDFFGVLPDIPTLSVVSVSVLFASALLFLFGQTLLFPWLCRLPALWRLFPNIDGEYEVELSSNWSIIQARTEGRELEASADEKDNLLQRTGKMTITARLTQVDMRVKMDDDYLTSETVTCSLLPGQGGRTPTLFYVFESRVTVPKTTDSQYHLGAARLTIPHERSPSVLEGHYWTDRNWHKGLNTAGRIRLRRR